MELGLVDDVYFKPLHPYTQILVAFQPEPDPDSWSVRRASLSRLWGRFPRQGKRPGKGARLLAWGPKV